MSYYNNHCWSKLTQYSFVYSFCIQRVSQSQTIPEFYDLMSMCCMNQGIINNDFITKHTSILYSRCMVNWTIEPQMHNHSMTSGKEVHVYYWLHVFIWLALCTSVVLLLNCQCYHREMGAFTKMKCHSMNDTNKSIHAQMFMSLCILKAWV